MDVKLPYVVWRDGRPRFVPSAKVRKLGFKGKDLQLPGGAWFSFDQAKAWADANLIAINAAKHAGGKPTTTKRASRHTVEELLEDWLNSDYIKGKTKNTRRNYRMGANVMIFKPNGRKRRNRPAPEREDFGQSLVSAIKAPELNAFFDYVVRTRGIHMARKATDCYSSAYSWATLDLRWKLPAHLNPRIGLKLKVPEGRIVVIEPKEFVHLVKTADDMGRPSIGDMLYLGLYTGQRQGDRLSFADAGYLDGRRKFRQMKTGMVIRLREPDVLTARLTEARKRTRELMLRHGTRCKEIVLSENSGAPYNDITYRKDFAKVRDKAAETMPSVADKRDQDLRDTCVTMLYRAGVKMKTIADITGHSYAAIQTIIDHYLGRDPEGADRALETMASFMKRELA